MRIKRAVALRLTRVQRLFQGIEHQVGAHCRADAPADDAPGEYVDHEGHVEPALPGRDVGCGRRVRLITRPKTVGKLRHCQ